MQLETTDALPNATKQGRVAVSTARACNRDCDAPSYWDGLARSSRVGRVALDELGLGSADRRGKLLRFDQHRAVVPVRNSDGVLVNAAFVVGDGTRPALALPMRTPTLNTTLLGSLEDITGRSPTGRPHVMVTGGGPIELLTATQMFGWNVHFLGTWDPEHYNTTVKRAARRARLAHACLHVSVLADDAYTDAATDAVRFAMRLGLALHRDLVVVCHEPDESLNAAWRAGWRPW